MIRTAQRLVLAALAAAPLTAPAHNVWLLPSATVVAEGHWLTVDAAVSNDLFYFNHVPLRLDGLQVTAPDGQTVAATGRHTGKYRSVFDVELNQAGTWRIAVLNNGAFASWTENGEPKRWRGRPADIASAVPADAADLKISQSQGRVETFVTAGAPTTQVLKPTGTGLELVADSHPNDLYAGEQARFALQLDGKPAANLDVTVIAGGTRYRNRQDEMKLKTDAEGRFSVTWPAAGMYWLEASLIDDKVSLARAKERRASYVATLEVLPQ